MKKSNSTSSGSVRNMKCAQTILAHRAGATKRREACTGVTVRSCVSESSVPAHRCWFQESSRCTGDNGSVSRHSCEQHNGLTVVAAVFPA